MSSRWQTAIAGALILVIAPVASSTPEISIASLEHAKSAWSEFSLLPSSSAATATSDALTTLEKLPVKGRAPKTGYSRNQFGPQWSDVDRNGCDTRNDILKRDLTAIVFREKTRNCVIESGILEDPYSGEKIEFQRGEKTSALVQIDHVVALSNAWQTGIFQATTKVRTAFANDPLNLN